MEKILSPTETAGWILLASRSLCRLLLLLSCRLHSTIILMTLRAWELEARSPKWSLPNDLCLTQLKVLWSSIQQGVPCNKRAPSYFHALVLWYWFKKRRISSVLSPIVEWQHFFHLPLSCSWFYFYFLLFKNWANALNQQSLRPKTMHFSMES